MGERTFKLLAPIMAIRVENEQPSVVTVPTNAVVTLVDGNINGVGLVQIRYQDQVLQILAIDLRKGGEPVRVTSA
jgi:hypothetical protein